MDGLEKLLGGIFADRLPALPPKVREWAGRIMPWVLIILGFLGLFAWLGTIGFFKTSAVAMWGAGRPFTGIAVALFHILVPVIQVLAIAGGFFMLSRRRLGWCLAFYSLLLGFVVNLIWFSVAGVIWDIVFAYLLFQIRPYFRQA